MSSLRLAILAPTERGIAPLQRALRLCLVHSHSVPVPVPIPTHSIPSHPTPIPPHPALRKHAAQSATAASELRPIRSLEPIANGRIAALCVAQRPGRLDGARAGVQARAAAHRRRPAPAGLAPLGLLHLPITTAAANTRTVMQERGHRSGGAIPRRQSSAESHRPQALRKHAKCNRQLATCNMQRTGVPFTSYEAKHAAKAQPSTSGLLCTIGRTDMRRAAQCQRAAAHQPASHLMYTSRREACSSRRPNASHAAR